VDRERTLGRLVFVSPHRVPVRQNHAVVPPDRGAGRFTPKSGKWKLYLSSVERPAMAKWHPHDASHGLIRSPSFNRIEQCAVRDGWPSSFTPAAWRTSIATGASQRIRSATNVRFRESWPATHSVRNWPHWGVDTGPPIFIVLPARSVPRLFS